MIEKLFNAESVRFIIAGGLNTLITYLFYLLLLLFSPYEIAYSTSFATGIASGYTLNALFVFRQPWMWKKMFQFPVVYIVQYAIGLLFMTILVDRFHIDKKVAPIIIILLSLPLTFLLSKFIVKHGVKQ